MASVLTLILFSSAIFYGAAAQRCGILAGNAACPNGLCCSRFGWCGSTPLYCSWVCRGNWDGSFTPIPSKPTPTPTPSGGGGGGGNGASIISEALFNQMLRYRNDARCPSEGFYSYSAFIAAAQSFSGFGATGDDAVRKRELAAFFGQTSHETTGGWANSPDGPYAWGYCYISEQGGANGGDAYCIPGQWPCAPGKMYYGRGPFQLAYNINYGQAGQSLGVDLVNNPDLVATNAIISFKTAIWFWMTPQGNKPSSHDVITGRWTPSRADRSAGRLSGYGVITNIINGGLECGKGSNANVEDRIGFYKRYCDLLGVSYGNNLDCYNQAPFS